MNMAPDGTYVIKLPSDVLFDFNKSEFKTVGKGAIDTLVALNQAATQIKAKRCDSTPRISLRAIRTLPSLRWLASGPR